MAEITCPFCGFRGRDEYAVQLHIEEHHTEDSPFVAADEGVASKHNGTTTKLSEDPHEPAVLEDTWTKCTRPGCGEYVLLEDVDEHLEVHDAIAAADRKGEADDKSHRRRKDSNKESSSSSRDIPRSPQKLHKSKPVPSNAGRSNHTLLNYFSGASQKGSSQPPPASRRPLRLREPRHPGRLGKRELGPHAFEKAMPADVRRRLLNDALPRYTNRIGRDGKLQRVAIVENETGGLINVLSDLCALDPDTEVTYLCDPSVRHVLKLRCDGNFCGYWNIQMLLSYLQSRPKPRNRGRYDEGGEDFEPLPNVLQIQDTIEQAWDNGICPYGRIETGGVRGTRKWIGSHEALAFFTQWGVAVEALSFKDSSKGNDSDGSDSDGGGNGNGDPQGPSQSAATALLDHIEAYFISGLEAQPSRNGSGGAKKHGTSHITTLAPIYFQRFGHSMTVVGLERRADGERNLLVFDPSFATTEGVERLLAGRRSYVQPETLLRAYRRGERGLARWGEFEVVVPKVSDEVDRKG